jgi:hypothetical protein
MSDKLNEQTDKMGEMAQATLDKGKDAVSKYMAESQRMREKADAGVRASYSSAKEMNEKAVVLLYLPRRMLLPASNSRSACCRRKTHKRWVLSIKAI